MNYDICDSRGYLKQWLPERVNEFVGVAHMKIYIADDSLIISGYVISLTYYKTMKSTKRKRKTIKIYILR